MLRAKINKRMILVLNSNKRSSCMWSPLFIRLAFMTLG